MVKIRTGTNFQHTDRSKLICKVRHRGYYIAARRYALRSLVKYLKFYEIPNHFTETKGTIYDVAIATVIFSHVKITSYFHA